MKKCQEVNERIKDKGTKESMEHNAEHTPGAAACFFKTDSQAKRVRRTERHRISGKYR